MTRVLVTGGRNYGKVPPFATPAQRVKALHEAQELFKVLDEAKPSVIIHGGAEGADMLAGDYAAKHGLNVIVVPASWALAGVMAGLLRNIRMIEHHKPDLVVAAPGSAGTEHCIKNALLRGVPVRRVTP